jgi:hypothetical protein
LVFNRVPDGCAVAGKLPEGEAENIDAVFTYHSFMVKDSDIPEGFYKSTHGGDGGGQVRAWATNAGPKKFKASRNPDDSIPMFRAPFHKRAEIRM